MFRKLNRVKLLLLAFIFTIVLSGCGIYATTQNKGQEINNPETAYSNVEVTKEAVNEATDATELLNEVTKETSKETSDVTEASKEATDEALSSDKESAIEAYEGNSKAEINEATDTKIEENGTYTSKEEVAEYIHTYNKLPSNFITKKEAKKLGWSGGGLENFAPGKCIGGDYFKNYEKVLPDKKGREYIECDIDTLGKSKRGAKRIIYSNDGLIYYTEDHYESFELLYGEE